MYLGIDASLRSTGLCLYRGEGDFFTSLIKTSDKDRGPQRLDYLHKKLQEYLNHNEGIKAASLEGYSMGRNPGRLADIGEWGGLVRLELYRRNIPLLIVPPATLKKFILPASSNDKSQVVMQVFKQYGKECGTDDEADALVMSVMARYFYKGTFKGLTKRQAEALQKSLVLIPKKDNSKVRERVRGKK